MNLEFVTEAWTSFKCDLSTIGDSVKEFNHPAKLDSRIYAAAIRVIALAAAALLAISGLKSLLFGSTLFSIIEIGGSVAAYDIYLIFKKFSSLNNPFGEGGLHLIKSVFNSIFNFNNSSNSMIINDKINISILTEDTNLSFIWNSAALFFLPNYFTMEEI